ncbi:MAG: hypothetical protein WC223_13115 [Bacteroidales bacterium]|jgi:hypothetical protein
MWLKTKIKQYLCDHKNKVKTRQINTKQIDYGKGLFREASKGWVICKDCGKITWHWNFSLKDAPWQKINWKIK